MTVRKGPPPAFRRRASAPRPFARVVPAGMAGTALLALLLAALATGCAGGRGAGEPRAGGEPAADSTAAAMPAATAPEAAARPALAPDAIVFALDGPVDPAAAPIPHNVPERVVFRNLYETLVLASPDGSLVPGLAASWTSGDGDRQWVFRLREGARFWDGSRVRAADVLRSWRAAREASLQSRGHSPLLWVDATRGSLDASDEQTLLIRLAEPQSDFPALLAHPDLAIAVPGAGAWPLGTGPCRPADLQSGLDPARGGDLLCLPNPYHPGQPAWSRLVFRIRPGADPRDLLGSADLLLARSRRDVDYYASVDEARLVPLPWDRLYLLLVPPEQERQERERWYTGWHPAELVRDVVTARAEPARDPFFAAEQERLCPQLTGPVERIAWPNFDWEGIATSRDRDLLLHPEDDEDARRLAERIAVVAARPLRPGTARPGAGPLQPPWPAPPATAPQAVGVPGEDWAGAVQSGRAGAYVLVLRRQYPTACLQLSCLLGLAYWLQQAATDDAVPDSRFPPEARAGEPASDFDLGEATRAALRLRRSGVAVPLVMTRPTLVARAGLYGVTAGFDGTPLLDGAAWAGTGAAP